MKDINIEHCPIEGYNDHYEVTRTGQVWSIKSDKYLKPVMSHNGYLTVYLFNNGKQKAHTVARLVWAAFEHKIGKTLKIFYKNGDHNNCDLSNLKVGNKKQVNTHYSIIRKAGVIPPTVKDRPVICLQNGQRFESVSEAAKANSVEVSTLVGAIKTKTKANDFNFDYADAEKTFYRIGDKGKLFTTMKEIADILGVSYSAVYLALKNDKSVKGVKIYKVKVKDLP